MKTLPTALRLVLPLLTASVAVAQQPNILFIFSDDHRWDLIGKVNAEIATPNLDALADSGVRFTNAFVTTAICSPSRAAVLSGRYGTRNGVPTLSDPLAFPQATFVHDLKAAGYRTGQAGKWHLGTTPEEAGFDQWARINSNGSWFSRNVNTNIAGVAGNLGGQFFETFMADVVIDWIADHEQNHASEPFVMWWCNQVPHVDGGLRYPDVKTDPADKVQNLPWGSAGGYRALYNVADMPVPGNWADDPAAWGPAGTKPGYLATSRFVTKSVTENYGGPGGYTNPAPGVRNATLGEDNVQQHQLEYYASVQALDAEIGRVLARLEDPDGDGDTADSIADETWVVFMGDNGWQTGSHRYTSKVLAYEEACRVPLLVRAPGAAPRVDDSIVLNIDLPSMFYALAGLTPPPHLQGRDLGALVQNAAAPWRSRFYYEAVVPENSLGAEPHDAVRTATHKYIRTYASASDAQQNTGIVFEELYDLQSDPLEMSNLAAIPAHAALKAQLAAALLAEKAQIAASPDPAQKRVGLLNPDFEDAAFDQGWNNPGVAGQTAGLLGSGKGALIGAGGATGRFSQPIETLSDFELTFAVRPVTASGNRTWNLVLHKNGASGASSSGAFLNIRGALNGAFQAFNGSSWVSLPGGAGAFAVGSTTIVHLRAYDFDTGSARYDLSWSSPGTTGLDNQASNLTFFQSAAAPVTGLNFARISGGNGTYVVDEIALTHHARTGSLCPGNHLDGGFPHTAVIGDELAIYRLLDDNNALLSVLVAGAVLPGLLDVSILGTTCPGRCTSLDVTPDMIEVSTNTIGGDVFRFPLPSDPSLCGVVLATQVVGLGVWPLLCWASAAPFEVTVGG